MATENGTSEEVESPEIHFEPIIQLPTVTTITLEEQEDQLLELRAKLFRYDTTDDGPQWKERGTGYVKLLKHKETDFVRVLMRRDKTLKICANHYVQPSMELKPNCGSEKAWVWTTTADFSDEEPHPELLAIRFANAENAQKFKEKFDEAKDLMKGAIERHRSKEEKSEAESPNGVAESEENEDDSSKEKTDSQKGSGGGDGQSETETDSVAEGLEKLTVKEDAAADSKDESSDAQPADTSQTDGDKPKDADK